MEIDDTILQNALEFLFANKNPLMPFTADSIYNFLKQDIAVIQPILDNWNQQRSEAIQTQIDMLTTQLKTKQSMIKTDLSVNNKLKS